MFRYWLFILSVVLVVFSCDDEISTDLPLSVPTLVVDGFINDLDEEQRIVLNFSQPFLDNTLYQTASGAEVKVINESTNIEYTFEERESGVYTWCPTEGLVLGTVGDDFSLSIVYEGVEYLAVSKMNRTASVDSILFFEQDGVFGGDDFIEARFYGRDFEGFGDTYWIKTFKNGGFLDDPAEINLAYDAAFDAGAQVDGIQFIPPIRTDINPIDVDEDADLDDDEDYVIGDTVRVEIHSITNETFDFLSEVFIQTDRPGGFAEVFAEPLVNVSTNISSMNSETAVLGQFSVSAVKSLEVVFTEDLIRTID